MSKKGKLLIVEDDAEISRQLKWALSDEHELHMAQDAPSAMKILQTKKPAVVTLDLGLPPRPHESVVGMELLEKILQIEPSAKVVVVTGDNDQENAMRAISRGAWDYYHKPIKIEELKGILTRAFHVYSLEKESRESQEEHEGKGRLDDLVGTSPEMNAIFAKILKVAPSNVSVLVVGESGTGKELIARSIHNQSDRREEPFIPINCGAIPDTLLEAELFGHEKGAFTGAHVQRKGKVEFANGGTLFLDEIGDIPPTLQVKLLRFIQERTIERIGGRESIEVDVRIIAATHRNLKELLLTGDFREDLYYRLSVVSIEAPPLRSRGNDILLLANYFRNKSCADMKRPMARFDPSAIQALGEHDWPGNIRELENRIKRAVVMSDGPVLGAEDLELPYADQGKAKKQTLKDFRERLERDFICEALVANNWNVALTSEQIGVARPTLYDLINKYDLRKQDYTFSSPAE
jgi:two-component system NtrC family response regulator